MFAGHMRRIGLPTELVSKNKMFLRNKLGHQLKATRIIKREDFLMTLIDLERATAI